MNSDSVSRAPAALPPIKGLIETTLLDWEGRIASEVFLGGCNFRCPFCHARHLALGGERLESIPIAAVNACLARHHGWVDGVVIGGGEPTLHRDLPALILHFRERGFPVKLDTNGSRPDILNTLIRGKMIDAVAMDIKGPLDERYFLAAGVEADLQAIRSSIELIIASNIEYEFRTTVCPRFHDSQAVMDTALAVRGARKYVLQRFRPLNCLDPAMEGVAPYNDEQMREFAAMARKYVASCQVRGAPQNEK